ncbi:MAG: RnfABCDGE type electron transport complex subunit C [Coprothermobacterota bacterium]|nr:RnfABCDGE type electron transport complex subunit C [Coprothermobacterota bacterium]
MLKRGRSESRFFPQGVWIPLRQDATIDKLIRPSALPQKVCLPLQERANTIPLKPLVRPGSSVKRGQQVAAPSEKESLPLFSPVWGEVVAVEKSVVPWSAEPVETIVIMPRKDELLLPITMAKTEFSPDELRSLLYRMGVVNLDLELIGKSAPLTLIVNGCELEPYLTSTQRLLEEKPKELLLGIELLVQAVEAERAILVISSENKGILEDLGDLIFAKKQISLEVFPPRYPMDHPVLIRKILGVPEENSLIIDLPLAVYSHEAVVLRQPFMEKVVTITGPAIRNPQNIRVRIGTMLEELVAQCDGFTVEPGMIIMGGPLRGQVINSLEVPITRYSKGFVFLPERNPFLETSCILCGSCIDSCPMGLYPVFICEAVKSRNWKALDDLGAENCIFCGTCSYICPAHIPHQKYLKRARERLVK